MRILKPALRYFMLVFGAGFLLGPIRVLLLVPRVGTRTAELIEMPLMLCAIWFAAGWINRRSTHKEVASTRLGVGLVTVGLVLGADIGVGVFLRGMTIGEVFLSRDPISGAAYYGLLVLCALLPWLRGSYKV